MTALNPPLRADGVTCRHCHEPVEAWRLAAEGFMEWRHVNGQTTDCVITTTYRCVPWDGWEAERKVRAAQREAWDDAAEIESLMDAETGGALL